jgi:type IV pilus assembly protein PilC
MKGGEKIKTMWKRASVQISRKEKLVFAKYLAVLLGAGLAIDDAINVLAEQSKRSMKKVLETLGEYLSRGETLSSGLMEYEYMFGPLFTNLVAAGEASGTLQTNLDHLVKQMQKEYALTSKVRGAMVYPAIIILAAIGIAAGMFIFVLPNVLGLFESLDLQLPLSTRILIAVSTFISENGILTLLLSIGAIVLFFIIRKIAFFKPFLHRALLLVPIIGGIVKKVNLARFTRSLGTMVESGVTIDEAIGITARVVHNVHYQRIFIELEEAIALGNEMSGVFEKYPHLIPPMATHVIYVGEQAGSLDEMLLHLADFYEQEVSDITDNLSDLIEPILLIIIGVFVGGLALSIMTPIYEVVGSF